MAIALAANMLLDGAAPMMLAGGSDALCPFTLSGFSALRALDPEPCLPFDQKRKGLNLGDNQARLLKKIEELTLYAIDQQKEIEVLKDKLKSMESLQSQIDELKALLKK